MQGARLLAEEIPCTIMGRCPLRNLIIWAWLNRMNEIGEEYSILNEKHRDVVTNDVCNNIS